MIIGMKKRPELLAPAGNMEKLVTAIHYGADAVYLGSREFSLRAGAGNFAGDQLRAAVEYAHQRSVRVYVTANIIARENDLSVIADHLQLIREVGADGVILADPGLVSMARRLVPEVPIHLSTQANVTNSESALFWAGQGVRRINLARELSFYRSYECNKKW